MFKALSEVAPSSVIIAFMLWAGIAYFATAPEIATRMARADFIPACEQNIGTKADAMAQETLLEFGGQNALNNQAAQGAAEMNRLLNNSFGDSNYGNFVDQYGTNPFDLLTGGALSRAQRQLEDQAKGQRQRAIARAQQAKAAILASAPSQCACQAKLAFIENRTDWALFTGTLGLIKPESVENFGQNMAMQTAVCSQRVMQNG
jgi:hypothetical protein